MHIPVLLQEVLAALGPKPGDCMIDGTLGSGGHAIEIIKRIGLPSEALAKEGIFLGVDRDSNAIQAFQPPETAAKIFTRQESYAKLPDIMAQLQLPKADGLLLDLGFSSDQLSDGFFKGRGFSFQSDEPLIMTYDDQTVPLAQQLRSISAEELAQILVECGEERYARQIAASIWQMVKQGKMETTQDLVRAVTAAVGASYERGRIHPATRTFQALRIFANKELEQLETVLKQLPEIVKPMGRVAIISFHSLEDRIVKNYFRKYARSTGSTSSLQVGSGQARGQRYSADQTGELPNTGVQASTLVTKKPITASAAEVARNPRSRSAKLRVLQL